MISKYKNIMFVVFGILAIIAVITFIVCGLTYKREKDYLKITGIDELRTKQPVSVETTDGGEERRCYEDVCLVYDEVSGAFIRAEIKGDKYEIEKGVSVGTDRNYVEKTFKNRYKIKDCKDNQWGFIEDGLWVLFEFDDYDKVKEISLYYGP